MPWNRDIRVICVGLIATVLVCNLAAAKAPWQWVSFRSKADTKPVSLELQNEHGPWLIFAASFAGEGAQEEALQLVNELRSRYRLPAYLHSHQFDFSSTIEGKGINPDRTTKRMRYDKAGVFEEIAVLIGDFQTVDDPGLQKALKKVKYARPQCLTRNADKTTRRFAGLRQLYSRVNGDEEKKRKGPLGNAFATPNPLIPREFFAPTGVDSFVIKMNQGVKHSLLDCDGKWSVRVATFRGNVVIDPEKVAEIEQGGHMKSRLEEAALKAHKLTQNLRQQGIEAYEFHDRHESYVTVGSYDWVGRARANGNQEVNPAIIAQIQRYSPNKQAVTGSNGQPLAGVQPKTIDGIAFDIQPRPVEVPRRSIARDYARQ